MSLSLAFDISYPTDFFSELSTYYGVRDYEQARDCPKMLWLPPVKRFPLLMSLTVRYFSAPVKMAAKMANQDGRLFVGHLKTVKTVNYAMRARISPNRET
jgi:hypothetical protein